VRPYPFVLEITISFKIPLKVTKRTAAPKPSTSASKSSSDPIKSAKKATDSKRSSSPLRLVEKGRKKPPLTTRANSSTRNGGRGIAFPTSPSHPAPPRIPPDGLFGFIDYISNPFHKAVCPVESSSPCFLHCVLCPPRPERGLQVFIDVVMKFSASQPQSYFPGSILPLSLPCQTRHPSLFEKTLLRNNSTRCWASIAMHHTSKSPAHGATRCGEIRPTRQAYR
jgi:hypothetical protein